MWIFQTILVLFFLYALLKVWKKYQAHDIARSTAFFWTVIWLGASAIVIWPNSTALVAKQLGFGRGADLVVYISIAVLFFVVFRLVAKVERQNRDITVLTRTIALHKEETK